MNPAYFDIQSLTGLQAVLAELTRMPFALYNSSGDLLLPSPSPDRLLTHITALPAGDEEYRRFVQKGIEKVSLRNDIALLKGPAQQHYLFMPLTINKTLLVALSNPFYLKAVDFEHFLLTEGASYGLSREQLDQWPEHLAVRDYADIQKTASAVRLIFETVLRWSYERTLNQNRFQWMKTLTDVALNITAPSSPAEVYALVLDTLLFVFDIETAAVMVKEGGSFVTAAAAGRMRDAVAPLTIRESPRLAECRESGSAFSSADGAEIAALGFPPAVTTLHLFPQLSFAATSGMAAVCNAALTREQSRCIIDFLRLVSLVLGSLSLREDSRKLAADLDLLAGAVARLLPHLHHREMLYEAIVHTAADLLGAERCSLMMPEDGALTVKAVKGVNQWLMQGVAVKAGEGIAGKVFKDGAALVSKDTAVLERCGFKPRHHYKTGSFMCAPLQFDHERLGVLNIADKSSGREFTDADLSILGHFLAYAALSLKVSGYHALAEQMKELSITDTVTGLFNRRYLEERFTEEIHRSERYNLTFSLVMLDIDDFKLFNDSEGHLAGDDVLKDVARIIHRDSRVNDVACRFGGEEFAILMPQTTKEEAFLVAERVRKNIRESLTEGWQKFPHSCITVSIGIASFPGDGESINELIRSADTALYRAKSLGKDRTMVYNRIESKK